MPSFMDLKDEELLNIAASFGAEVREGAKKAEIITAILDEGVDYDMYIRFKNADKEEPDVDDFSFGAAEEGEEPLQNPLEVAVTETVTTTTVKTAEPLTLQEGTVVVKMERENATYQTFGKTFTKKNPFVVMSAEEADEIFDNEQGFRLATPREVREYYT